MRIAAATTAAVALTLASAFALYAESVSVRRIEQKVQGAERQRDRLEEEIAGLRAERAYLARPSRIEPAARAIGMRPPIERHYATLSELGEPEPATAKAGDAQATTGNTPR